MAKLFEYGPEDEKINNILDAVKRGEKVNEEDIP